MYKDLRPKGFDEFVGQEEAVERVRNIISIVSCKECNGTGKVDGNICSTCGGLGWKERPPDLLFAGPPGCGKTTLAHIIAREIKARIVEINASDERGIQTIREDVKSQSKMKGRRIIFLDEADNLTQDSMWALRRIMETSARGVFFILSCNYIHKLVEPIQDRCVVINFRKLTKEELKQIAFRGLKYMARRHKLRIKGSKGEILEALNKLAEYADGSARRALNKLYDIVREGEITPQKVIQSIPPDIAEEIIRATLDDDFERALERLETLYVENKLDPWFTVKRLHSVISDIEDRQIRIWAYSRLASTYDRIIQRQGDPFIELCGFLADLWIAKYARK